MLFRRPLKFILNTLGEFVGRHCPACGHRTLLRKQDQIPRQLFTEWDLDEELQRALIAREQVWCLRCGNQVRTQQMAATIVAEMNARLGTHATSFAALLEQPAMRALRVAEINACGLLHPMLARLPNLSYSEYRPTKRGVRDEDAQRLSYADESFDLALHSETLEHLPDPDRALAENRRVLKPGGMLMFTTPVIFNRATRQRARIGSDGRVEHLLPPSYHGIGTRREDHLVFSEFGGDLADRVKVAGFADVRITRDKLNPLLNVFTATTSPK